MKQIYPKKKFKAKNRKIALLRASMLVACYIKLFRTGTDRHNVILISLLLLVAKTEIKLLEKEAEYQLFFKIRSGSLTFENLLTVT